MTSPLHKIIETPVGTVTLVEKDSSLAAILWGKVKGETGNTPVLRAAEKELREYFAGKRKNFSVSIKAEGTPFQKSVWRALEEIPFGETRSYAEIARRIKRASAVRAVANAIGRNPHSIIVPCHRVIGSNGTLTGFAGGLKAKAFLLKLEA